MSKASLSNGTGPGSSISLAPETVRVRDALIEKFSGAPLEDMTNFVTMALSNETDELRRLGILAARIYILRHRVANLREFNRNPSLKSLPELDTTSLSLNLTTASEPSMTEEVDAPIETNQWSRIQMTEPGEVNGVRFLAGTIIDAQTQDANKLINSRKAVRVDQDGNIVEHHNDDFNTSDADTNASDETAGAPENDDFNTSDADANASDETAGAPENDTSSSQDSDDDTDNDAPEGLSEDDAEVEGDQSQQADAGEKPKAPTS